jgi:hypothetical protein
MFRPRALLAGIVVAGAATMATAVPAGAAGQATPCAGTIEITRMAFRPSTVFPGQSSTVHVAAVNCSNQSRQTTLTWFGRYAGTGPGIPPGCPAIDPLPEPANFTPHGSFTAKLTYLVLTGCTATSLQSTVEFSAGGAILAERSARLTITRPAAPRG